MPRISDIVRDGEGSAGSGGAWRVTRVEDCEGGVTRCVLSHYRTSMLTWRLDDPADEDHLDYSTGWGSVSDQGGMNQAFRALGLPFRYSRAGGAVITRL